MLKKFKNDYKKIIFTTGSRKSSTARVRLKSWGNGKIYINGKRLNEYFKSDEYQKLVLKPLELTNSIGLYDVVVKVEGGGISGQAGAISHGIARALAVLEPEKYRKVLKKAGLLRRDPREKERMKYARSKRRRSWQYTKR
ncbi:MAG: 30S ribosomal protein S9 [candidate division WOR-3 bacterium]|nr:30S ribosomal protein S9 [candidate division WOR-3 bacterium]MCX7947269.1 30S ribosomal protein S9 [candidate division WOR-3 bacterium]MDW8150174.1 30S ribosomal protein S9 [candidate division WOR-3 bacterium]